MDIFVVLSISIWVGFAGLDYYGPGLMFGRPIVTGSVVGLLMGDFQAGLVIGATLELAWLGLMPLAGAQPPNVTIGSAVGVVFGIQSGLEPTAVVGVAIPFAVLMQQLIVIQFTSFATLMPKIDIMVDKADTSAIEKANYFGMLSYFSIFFICAFVPIYFGDVVARTIVDYVPKVIIDGLSIAGAMMPALGFSMLLRMMLKEIRYVPFYIIGFVLATFLKLPIIAIALLGLSVAIIDFFNSNDKVCKKSDIIDNKNDLKLKILENKNIIVTTKYFDITPSKPLSKKLMRVSLYRLLWVQSTFNYQRMQASGWLYALIPSLKHIHKNKNDLKASMKLHNEFFNTSTWLISFVMGVVIAMEQGKQSLDTIRSFKIAAMGPLGAIGDAMSQLTILPITASIAASLALDHVTLAPFLFLFLFNIIRFAIFVPIFKYGYNLGLGALEQLHSQSIAFNRGATILGLTVVGALTASFVKIKLGLIIPLSDVSLHLQEDVLDKIMPNILPLVVVVCCYKLIIKEVSPVKIIFIMIISSVVLHSIGIL